MTVPASPTADPPTLRPAVVDQRLARTTAGLCRDHPASAPAVRGVLAPLRDRLRRVHERCVQADADAWAAYRADLDRGLDELSVEVARAAQEPARGPAVDDVLTTAAARLELRAWELRLHTTGGPDALVAEARQLAAALRAGLDELAADPGSPALRARAEHDLETLRRAVERAGRS
ncbi:hypothetical protein O2W14_06615 [Modestobacter sp. VKM Ac-2986]|uniref:hypothetical protein n=1 Tax=Modestobacter sp. VKM Ac-2986 TaxID=3004140 RepID=UPI0022AB3146|nr:hypothetical protein [Modestobacter sp. VKM Ac-2986]MCZ2828503.1 hypothetical protein [Modestobacter sp. VKM Ac-2986]